MLGDDDLVRGRAALAEQARALLGAFDGPVAAPLVAERAEAYVTVLWALSRARRAHEIEPLHEDLVRALADASYDAEQIAHDLGQLEAWGCVARRTEALKIRGYRDLRRERFRWRLTEDAVALIEWLEQRLATRREGRTRDSRDRLADVRAHAMEAVRLAKQWRDGERGPDTPRRALYLLAAIDEAADAIAEELLAFRTAMVLFSSRPYDAAALRGILEWLERYVRQYLARLEELRADVAGRLDDLAQPRFRRALAECHAALSAERAAAPRGFGGGGGARTPDELLDAQRPFFAVRGRLAELCARIDDSARDVVRKMHRHLKELERRSARLEDLRARVRELAALPAAADPVPLADVLNALTASAHVRFAARRLPAAVRVPPPLPRRHAPATPAGSTARPLAQKGRTPEAVRELRARRLAELARWMEEAILRGARERALSDAPPRDDEAARRWLDVARARWLARGRSLAALGVRIAPLAGVAGVGNDAVGLEAPDCRIQREEES